MFLIFTALCMWDRMGGTEGGGENKGSLFPPLILVVFICILFSIQQTSFIRQSNLSSANKKTNTHHIYLTGRGNLINKGEE